MLQLAVGIARRLVGEDLQGQALQRLNLMLVGSQLPRQASRRPGCLCAFSEHYCGNGRQQREQRDSEHKDQPDHRKILAALGPLGQLIGEDP
jgi:hypothetical protein